MPLSLHLLSPPPACFGSDITAGSKQPPTHHAFAHPSHPVLTFMLFYCVVYDGRKRRFPFTPKESTQVQVCLI